MSLYINPMTSSFAADRAAAPLEQRKESVALKELEQFFASMLVREMRNSVPEGGLFDGGQETKFYTELLDESFSSAMAEGGHLGMAKMVGESLHRNEKAVQGPLRRLPAGIASPEPPVRRGVPTASFSASG